MVGKRGRESTRPDHSNRETGAVSERNYEKIEVRVWEYYSISELEACSLFFFYPTFTSGISSYPHHGYNGCRYCGFFTGCSGRTDPCCTHTTSPARFVEQVRRRRGRDTDNNRTDRRSGAFGWISWEDRATE